MICKCSINSITNQTPFTDTHTCDNIPDAALLSAYCASTFSNKFHQEDSGETKRKRILSKGKKCSGREFLNI
jgi:hypothetical protein